MTALGARRGLPLPTDGPVRLLIEQEAGELAAGPTMFRSVVAGNEAPLIRVYRPSPVVAFGGRDRRNPGFEAAATAALAHGFVPEVRAPGGHAVAYHASSVCIEVFACDADPHGATVPRFEAMAALFREVFAELGIDADMGAVPQEYCPGDHSVSLGGSRKLVGTAQRIAKGGWMFGAGLVCADADPIRAVLDDVYRTLDMPFRRESVCATTELDPEVGPDAFIHAFGRVLARHADIRPVTQDLHVPSTIGSTGV